MNAIRSKRSSISVIEHEEYATKKKIKFVRCLDRKGKIISPKLDPVKWENIILIAKDYHKRLDLMYAFNGAPRDGFLFLGEFNDGVV